MVFLIYIPIYSVRCCYIYLYLRAAPIICFVLGSIEHRVITPLNFCKTLLVLWRQHVDGAEVVVVLIFFLDVCNTCPQ